MMKFMAQNGFFLLVVGVWMMMSAGLYAEESRFACRVVVKDLKDILIFKDPDDPRDGGLTASPESLLILPEAEKPEKPPEPVKTGTLIKL